MTGGTFLPARWRGVAYVGYGFGSVIVTAIQAGYAAAMADPLWLRIVVAVWLSLGTGLGLIAAANTPRDQDQATTDTAATSAPAGTDT